MKNSADKNESNENRPDPFLSVLHIVLGIVRGLIGFFTFTEADRLKAGINVGSERRDE